MLAKEKQACIAASMPDYAPHMMHELALLPRSARTAQELPFVSIVLIAKIGFTAVLDAIVL